MSEIGNSVPAFKKWFKAEPIVARKIHHRKSAILKEFSGQKDIFGKLFSISFSIVVCDTVWSPNKGILNIYESFPNFGYLPFFREGQIRDFLTKV